MCLSLQLKDLWAWQSGFPHGNIFSMRHEALSHSCCSLAIGLYVRRSADKGRSRHSGGGKLAHEEGEAGTWGQGQTHDLRGIADGLLPSFVSQGTRVATEVWGLGNIPHMSHLGGGPCERESREPTRGIRGAGDKHQHKSQDQILEQCCLPSPSPSLCNCPWKGSHPGFRRRFTPLGYTNLMKEAHLGHTVVHAGCTPRHIIPSSQRHTFNPLLECGLPGPQPILSLETALG